MTVGRFSSVASPRQAATAGEPVDVFGEEVFDSPKALLVGSFGT
jgi:hypothetical protein